MQYTIKGGKAFGALHVALDRGESVKAEKNAMVAMSGDLALTGRADGGLLRSIARRFSGESFFLQHLSAKEQPGWALLAPQGPGAITAVDMHAHGITAQKTAFLAATTGVQVSSAVQLPLKGLLGGEGFVLVKFAGEGTVFLSAIGAIEMLTLVRGQMVSVDNTHLVAWEDSVDYNLGKGGTSWMSAVLGGEGLVARIAGPGRVWIQTRTETGIRQALGLLRPAASSGKK